MKGNYQVPNSNARDKMHFTIRKRAIQAMEDLLLICEKMPLKDRQLIFLEQYRLDHLSKPLIVAISENTALPHPKARDGWAYQRLFGGLEAFKIEYDFRRILNDAKYRNNKLQQLRAKVEQKSPNTSSVKELYEAWNIEYKPLAPAKEY